MAKVKLLKYPKKPKASASIESKERYLKRVSEIDKENNRRKALKKKDEALTKRIGSVGRAY